ncbi:MAG: glycosyltransferase family 2 protein [Patescibacteria group bacterium]|nr:glycosyltransferase family 2 protein [Patescibacteria group bacterium]
MTPKPKLSVIIPAYNEERRIAATLESVDAYLSKQKYSYEVVIIDNGSNDSTYELVKKIAEGVKHIKVDETHQKGKGGAVAHGIVKHADGEYIMFMDADNATPISEIEKFWPQLEQGFGVVIGSRYLAGANVTQKQPLYRIVLSRMSNLLIQILAVPGIKDTQLGFKVFTRAAAKDIFHRITVFGWGFDMEVLTIARAHGFKIKEVPVLWREQGGSHVPLSAYVRSLIDLFKIKWNLITGKYR